MLCRLWTTLWVLALVGLCPTTEAGGPYSEPAPLTIPFGPGKADLSPEVIAAIDRLAVRAMHCDADGELVFLLHHMPKPAPGLLRRREAAVRTRLDALGMAIKLELRPLARTSVEEWSPDDPGDPNEEPRLVPLPPWHVEGSVRSKSDFCFEEQDIYYWGGSSRYPRLLPWLNQLEQAMDQPTSRLPAFWQRLSPAIRRDFLSFTLARVANERMLGGHASVRKVFWWLVDQEARQLAPEWQLQWALYLWQAGSDEDLQELQRRLVVPELDLDKRVGRAPLLMNSSLPWPVIERRLMAPGLMRSAGETLMTTIGQVDSRLNMTFEVLRRNEWASWGRLTNAAGELRSCFLADAIFMLGGESPVGPEVMAALGNLSLWAAGPAGRYEVNSRQTCDPTATLLRVAMGCGRPPNPEAAVRWLEAGFVPDDKTIADALSPAGLGGDGSCCIEGAPGQRFPYRLRLP